MRNNSSKIIIGVSGKNGSGKDTVCDFIAQEHQGIKLVFSDLLRKSLSVFIHDIGRDDFSWLSTNLRKRYGQGILAKGMEKEIANQKSKLIIISGVRDLGEFRMIKKYDQGYLIYIDTHIKTRWQRLYQRGSKADDQISLEEFIAKKEQLPSEQYLNQLKSKADFIISNNTTRQELREQIEQVMQKILF
ncbi:MAG: AAA family ATPase [Candidatus Moranbacteria bacterium]|nr:AAA family ATPase [Candidatus Moranbacteria bacterium]